MDIAPARTDPERGAPTLLTADPIPEPNRAAARRWRSVGFMVLVVGAAIATHIPGLGRQLFDPDEAAIATMGNVVAHGGVLYRDAIDRKPPLAPLLYAMSFLVTGTRDLRPLHLLVALGVGGSALLLAAEARRIAGRRAGWWAAILLIVGAIATSPSAAQAANYSELALLPATGAIVAARRGTRGSAIVAGILLGLAILTRQTWILGLAPAMLAAWLTGDRRPSRPALLVAATAATLGAVAILVPFGAFFHWTFTANVHMLDLGDPTDLGRRAWASIGVFVLGHLAIVWLAMRRGFRRSDVDLWLWLASGVVSVGIGLRFFDHYWFQVLPPLCLLAALAIARTTQWERAVLVAVLAISASYCLQLASTTRSFTHDWSPVVSVIQADTRPGDRITVWGSVPELYWLSGRSPGGALVITDFVVGRTAGRADGPQRLADATPGALRTFRNSLYARPPKLFLDTSGGDIRSYQHYPMALVPPVAKFVDRYYREVGSTDGVTIYELDRSPPARG
ncbi:MAG: glycosyltransferase [Actinomycetia bacterium]|nr:glycosyltransferase [Actinomycetes bacterium]